PPRPLTPPLFPYTTLFRSRLAFDIANGAADLGDDHFGVGLARDALDALLDLVRDVWNHLDRPAEEIAAPFATDHGRVNLTRRHVDRKSTRLNSSHDQISYA